MVEETFVAPTPKEAFEMAREKYGHISELELLKAAQIKNADGAMMSEITVSVPSGDFMASIGIDESKELVDEMVELKSQIDKMKNLINTQEPTRSYTSHIQEMMVSKGLSSRWVQEILKRVEKSAIAEDEQLLLSYFMDEVNEALQVKEESIDTPTMMMLIGTTGVGKTTTIAKLAGRYAILREKPLKVLLVNLDTFRVGSFEQLGHYASAMNIEHIGVGGVAEFETLLGEIKGYDVVLIDTAGISPYDTNRLIQTIEFLKSASRYHIKTHLVISATAKRADVADIYEHFSFLDIDSAILTKFDETRNIGELLGFLMEKNIPVGYISDGQNVPNDLKVAEKEELMKRLMGELNV